MQSSFETITLRRDALEFTARTCGDGPTVLCLHGFPDHVGSFRLQLPALASAGYRAIAPTLRGYEPSSIPADHDYRIVRMAEDVVHWIDALGERRVHLVGHDWGAVIGYAVAARAPERLHSLTTLAVPHLGGVRANASRIPPVQLLNSSYVALFQLRGVAEVLLAAGDWALVQWLWRRWSPGWEPPAEELAAITRAFARPGVRRAVLGYYRALFDLMSEEGRATWRSLTATMRVPTLALTGARDGCMDTRLYDIVMREQDFEAELEVVRIPDAGHFLHQEKPEQVNRRLVEWITRWTVG